jgi:hypothetical protein
MYGRRINHSSNKYCFSSVLTKQCVSRTEDLTLLMPKPFIEHELEPEPVSFSATHPVPQDP